MVSEWLIVLSVLAQAGDAPAAEQAPSPSAEPPRAVAPPLEAQTVPVRRAPAAQPAQENAIRLPTSIRRPTTQPTTTAPAGAPLNRPPARALEQLQLSGADINYVIQGNKLILMGPSDDLDQIQNFIDEIRAEIPRPTIHTVQLKNTIANEIAPLVEQIYNRLTGPDAGVEDQVIVVPEPRSNSLLVAVVAERFPDVERLIQQIDNTPVAPDDATMKWFTLEHVTAETAADLLKRVLRVRESAGGGAGQASLDERIKIEPWPLNNQLMVSASPEDLVRIEELLKGQIDLPPAEGATIVEIQSFRLINTDAEDLVAVLQEIIQAGEQGVAEANTSAGTRAMRQALQEHIRRLKLVIDASAPDAVMPELNLDKPIRLVADSNINAIWVGSTRENLAAMGEVITLLDSVPLAPSVQVKVFMLTNADADTVVTLLRDFFDTARSLPLQPGQPSAELTRATPEGPQGRGVVYQVAIAGDARSNAVIVSGQVESISLAETIINSIDGESARLKHPLRLITLESASASELVTTIQELLTQRDEVNSQLGQNAQALEKVFVAADVRSNSILISAKQDNYEEILELVQKLDSAKDLLGEVRVLTLHRTQANQIATQIEQLWERRAQMLGGEQAGLRDLPVVVPDLRSNSLVIASSPSDFKSIQALIEKLEAQPLSPIADIRIIKLEHNDASTVGPMLQTLFEQRMQQRLTEGQTEDPADRVAVEADAGNNLLLVASSLENFTLIEELAKSIDAEPMLEGQIKVYMLNNANAEQMAQTLTDLFQGGVVSRNPLATTGPLGEAATKVTVIADVRANAVIVSASKEYMTLVDTLVTDLDEVGVPRIYDNLALIRVEFADAVRLKGMLDELFQRSGGGGQNVDIPTTILADERTNTLVIWGGRDGVARARKLVADLDVDEGTQSLFQVYILHHVSAQRVGPMLDNLFQERQRGGGTGGTNQRTPITISAEEGSNSLVVSASREDHQLVKELLGEIDKPSTIASQMHFIPLAKAKAEPLAETLQQLIDERLRAQGGTGGGGAAGTGISIAAEPRTNSLMVWATQSDFQQIHEMVTKLDNQRPSRNVVMHLFRLRNSLADDVANMLVNHIQAAGTGTSVASADEGGGTGGGASGDAEQAVLIQLRVRDPITGQDSIRTLLRQDITVTPDAKSNTLIVSAPPDSIDMLESLIRTLDEIPPLTAAIRVFPLLNANAEEMQRMLEQLFQVGEFRPDDDRERQTLVVGGQGGGLALAGGGLGEGVVTGKDEISFTVDLRTNAVIAAGTEAQLLVVHDMIEQLDSIEIEDRINRVVTVKYNEAPLISDALNQFIQDETARLERLGDNMAVQRVIEREVSIVPQEDTNRLLVSVSPRYESQVMEIIRQLDQPPPMVKVELLIAEVTVDDSLELGLEFALQDLLFSEKSFVNANGIVQGSNFDSVVGTDLGASGSGALGGFSFTITGEDFSFLLRTLKTEGRLKVQSRPLLMVQDGKEANITVGQNVPFVRNVNVLDTGQVQSNVEYEEIGIILNVTPHINPDGFVHLELRAEVSQITDSSVTITEGFTAPIFSNRSTETQVTVKDLETVVIGGLISTQEQNRENKVPVLGDLPGVGPLFRATQQSSDRTELLLIITPEVVRTVDDTRDASMEQITEQTEMIDQHLRDSRLFRRLQKRPGDRPRGVPIDLLDRNGQRNGAPQNGGARGPSGLDDRPAAGEVFAPRPDVYGPPRPAMLPSAEAGDDVEAKMVGPTHYDQYLKQRR